MAPVELVLINTNANAKPPPLVTVNRIPVHYTGICIAVEFNLSCDIKEKGRNENVESDRGDWRGECKSEGEGEEDPYFDPVSF